MHSDSKIAMQRALSGKHAHPRLTGSAICSDLSLPRQGGQGRSSLGGWSGGGGGGAGAGGGGAGYTTKRQRQLDLHEAHGGEFKATVDRRVDALVLLTGSLVAGGGGAASLPYSSIRHTLNKDFLEVLSDLKSGFPCATSTREVVLPKMVEMVKKYQDEHLKGVDFSVHVDEGASELCNGIKVLPWIATSPLLPYDFVLEIDLLPVHETAVPQ